MNAGTPDRRNSRLTSELPILKALKTSRWPLIVHTGHVRYDQDSEPSRTVKVRDVGTPDPCRDSRPSELPTYVGTPDPHGFRKLAVGFWSSIPDTSGMNTGHVRYDQDSETSKSVEVRDVGTPDPCRDSRPSELPTYVGTPD